MCLYKYYCFVFFVHCKYTFRVNIQKIPELLSVFMLNKNTNADTSESFEKLNNPKSDTNLVRIDKRKSAKVGAERFYADMNYYIQNPAMIDKQLYYHSTFKVWNLICKSNSLWPLVWQDHVWRDCLQKIQILLPLSSNNQETNTLKEDDRKPLPEK